MLKHSKRINMYGVDVVLLMNFTSHAGDRPFHAALVRLGPRAQDSDLHWHADFHEFFLVVAGEGVHRLTGESRPLTRGDLVFVRAHDRHAFGGAASNGLEFINIAFPVAAWNSFADLGGAAALRNWEHEPEPPTFHYPPDSDELRDVRATFDLALQHFHDAPSVFDLVRFWIDLLPLVPASPPSGAPGLLADRRPDWLVEACSRMRHEEHLHLGVSRLVELSGVSPAHLSRTMRQYHGCTPTEFVLELRVGHAARLLASTTDPITSIALRSGFSSQSYFTRCFVRSRGLAPRDYRRRAQRALIP